MSKSAPQSLTGKTIRWTFNEGPTKGKTFEHVLAADGSVSYKMLDEHGKPGKGTQEKKAGAERIDDSVWVISYLGSAGYTLTVLLNFTDMSAMSYASNEKNWLPAKGSFEIAA